MTPEKTAEIYRANKTIKVLVVWFAGKREPIERSYRCYELAGHLPPRRGVDGLVPIDMEIRELPDGSLPMSFNGDEPIEGIER